MVSTLGWCPLSSKEPPDFAILFDSQDLQPWPLPRLMLAESVLPRRVLPQAWFGLAAFPVCSLLQALTWHTGGHLPVGCVPF